MVAVALLTPIPAVPRIVELVVSVTVTVWIPAVTRVPPLGKV